MCIVLLWLHLLVSVGVCCYLSIWSSLLCLHLLVYIGVCYLSDHLCAFLDSIRLWWWLCCWCLLVSVVHLTISACHPSLFVLCCLFLLLLLSLDRFCCSCSRFCCCWIVLAVVGLFLLLSLFVGSYVVLVIVDDVELIRICRCLLDCFPVDAIVVVFVELCLVLLVMLRWFKSLVVVVCFCWCCYCCSCRFVSVGFIIVDVGSYSSCRGCPCQIVLL